MAKYVKTDEARRGLKILKDIVNKPMVEAGMAAMRPMLDDAKATVPRDTGLLASRLGIVRARTGSRLRVRLLLGAVGRTKREHKLLALVSTLLEFGRLPNKSGEGGFAPRGWLTRVFENHKKQIVDRYANALLAALQKNLPRK